MYGGGGGEIEIGMRSARVISQPVLMAVGCVFSRKCRYVRYLDAFYPAATISEMKANLAGLRFGIMRGVIQMAAQLSISDPMRI